MATVGPELRIGLLGLGRVAERGYLPALELARGARLAAAAEPDTSRRFRGGPAVPAFASARELLDGVSVDALVVATPSSSHVADATVAAARGVPSLVEKPPAAALPGALALAALEPAPSIGFCRRFVPQLAAMRTAVAGLPAGYRLELALETRREGWGAYEADDGPLLDLGVHLVDLARWLTDAEPVRVRHLGGRAVAFELELERGSAVARCSHRRPYCERIALYDARGRRIAAWVEGSLARRVWTRLAGGAGGGPLVPLLVAQIEAFVQALRTGEGGPIATARDGVEAMRVLEAVRASEDAEGAWVDMRPQAAGH